MIVAMVSFGVVVGGSFGEAGGQVAELFEPIEVTAATARRRQASARRGRGYSSMSGSRSSSGERTNCSDARAR